MIIIISQKMNCFNSPVSDKTCIGQTLPLTDLGIQKFVGMIISSATFLINMGVNMTTFDMNMLLALNSFRCAITSGAYNIWLLLAAANYASMQFGLQGQLLNYFNIAVPYVCQCYNSTTQLATYT